MGHMVNLVLPCDAPAVPHLVDVGYGGLGGLSMLFRPLPLVHGAVRVSFAPPEEHRLVRAPRPADDSTLADDAPAAQGWCLQARADKDEEWRTPHWFSTAEYTEADFEGMNFCLSKLPTRPTYNLLMCIKLHELPGGAIARTSVTGARAVKKVGGGREVLERWEWEEERVEAMRRLCGVNLEEGALEWVREKPGMALPFREDAEG
ncbi:hypothetical protein FIBSPDRAFT_850267, partial [Athelia psychrophila]